MHVAIIMDGNGRWANARGLPRTAGHTAGAKAVRKAVQAAPGLGITDLTLYAFSSDNWQRPRPEVRALLSLFRRYLRSETAELVENGVRLMVVGRRDRLPRSVVRAIDAAEEATCGGRRLRLRVAIDYSGRDALVAASRRLGPADAADREAMRAAMARALNTPEPVPDVDLLLRTGGEQRLSDFLLWECAYAELHFMGCMWPDFNGEELRAAVEHFGTRQRRYGRVLKVV